MTEKSLKKINYIAEQKFLRPQYSCVPNKRAARTPYSILFQLPPCTILFGPARLLIFGHFSSLYEMKF